MQTEDFDQAKPQDRHINKGDSSKHLPNLDRYSEQKINKDIVNNIIIVLAGFYSKLILRQFWEYKRFKLLY